MPPPDDVEPPFLAAGPSQFSGANSLTPLPDGFEIGWRPLRLTTGPDAGAIDLAYAYDLFLTVDGTWPDPDGSPTLTTDAGADRAVITGLGNATLLRVLVRAFEIVPSSAPADRNLVVLSGEVRPLLYVDSAAAAGGDGLAPERAFQQINDAVIAAFGSGAAILVAGGTYQEEVALFGAMDLYGGFPPGFSGNRDPALHPTIIAPGAGAAVAIRLFANLQRTRLDGLELDGRDDVLVGLDVRDADLEVVDVSIGRFAAEGAALNCRQRTTEMVAQELTLFANGAEGLQAKGSFAARWSNVVVVDNAHEGAEFDDLTAQPNETTTLHAWRCTFSRNAEEGLDCDLDELDPLTGTSSQDGRIELALEECAAEQNGASGVLLDIDYGAADGLAAAGFLRSSRFRANGRHGLELDGDQAGLYVLCGNRVAANRADGILAGSDSPDQGRALFLVANHAEFGDDGSGFLLTGPGDAHLSHLVSFGASGAALQGNGALRAVNSAFWDGVAPSNATVEWSLLAGGGAGCFTGPVELATVPLAAFHTTSASTSAELRVPAGFELAVDDFLELADDGVARRVLVRAGDLATFSPPLAGGVPARTFVAHLPGATADEQLDLVSGSTWRDRGDALERDLDATTTDVGHEGGRLAAFRAGFGELLPFVAERLTPGGGTATIAPTELRIRFTRAVQAASVTAASFAVTVGGNALAGSRSVSGHEIVFVPAAPFAAGSIEVALGADLAATDGAVLALPLRFTVVIP